MSRFYISAIDDRTGELARRYGLGIEIAQQQQRSVTPLNSYFPANKALSKTSPPSRRKGVMFYQKKRFFLETRVTAPRETTLKARIPAASSGYWVSPVFGLVGSTRFHLA